ncbi:MAG: response regulator [Chloroflexi bacterium]|nr:response regulator [Chloroflexota bacterium]
MRVSHYSHSDVTFEMSDVESESSSPPEEFVDAVRDALLHLYDPMRLHHHPLKAYLVEQGEGLQVRGKELRQALLDAIEALRPTPDTPPDSRAWRAHTILELRYIEGLEAVEVSDHVALSKSQYHREHQRALQGVAAELWERWTLRQHAARGVVGVAPLAKSEVALFSEQESAGIITVIEEVQGLIPLLHSLLVRKGLILDVVLGANLGYVIGDRVIFRQALLTLLTGIASVAPAGRIVLEAERPARELSLSVRVIEAPDRSPGLDTSSTLPFIEALQGTVVSPEPWHWAVRFPTLARRLLLVVDNNDDFRMLMSRYLEGSTWRVQGTGDVEQALILTKQLRPSLVLLDVVIPGRDGWELLQDLRHDPDTAHTPVVVCSVLHEPEIALTLGAAGYLQKPVSQEQLLQALQHYGHEDAVPCSSDPAAPLRSGSG